MKPKVIAMLVVLSAVVGIGAGFLVKRLNDGDADPQSSNAREPSGQTTGPTDKPTKKATTPTKKATTEAPTEATTAPTPTANESDDAVPPGVAKNRAERKGPSWSPADPTGPDGEPLEIGNAFPGTFQPVRVGDNVDKYVDAGYLKADIQKESGCEGDYWTWTGQLSEGLDVITDQQGVIGSLGMTKAGLETPEGISIGNSLKALRDTYGTELSAPAANDYGNAAVFLPGGDDGWLGFGFDVSPEELKPTSRVTFIEASKGSRPGMLRDGC